MHKRVAVLLACVLCCVALPAAGQVHEAAAGDTLHFDLEVFPPMVTKTPSGEFIGVEPALLRTLAADRGCPVVFHEVAEFDSLFNNIRGGVARATRTGAAAGVTIDEGREEEFDFVFPHIPSTGLQVLIRAETQSKWLTIVKAVFSPTVTGAFAAFLLLTGLLGFIFWLLEHGQRKGNIKSYRDADQYATCVITTIGEGQFNPSRWLTIIVSKAAWFYSTALILGAILGVVQSAVNIEAQRYRYNGLDDFRGKTMVTVAGTHAEKFLLRQSLTCHLRPETEERCYEMVQNGEAEGMIFDSVPLQYYANRVAPPGKFAVVGEMIDPQSYGIIVPEGSPDKEWMDRLMLRYHRDGTLAAILQRNGL